MDRDEIDWVFQTDDEEVLETYRTRDNYLMAHSPGGDESRCAVYFSSNDLYFPNNRARFHERVTRRNTFEWFGTRVPGCGRHIFIRDVFKQWYLGGINGRLNSPQKVLEWLKNETRGCRVTMAGSSSGGYAAVLFGSLLHAERVFSFNGYFDLAPETDMEDAARINPLLVRYRNDPERAPFYRLAPFLHERTPVYYFHSLFSPIDRRQRELLGARRGVHVIPFRSSRHGIPFLKCCLSRLFQYSDEELQGVCGTVHHPLRFSLRCAGVRETAAGFFRQAWQHYRKRH